MPQSLLSQRPKGPARDRQERCIGCFAPEWLRLAATVVLLLTGLACWLAVPEPAEASPIGSGASSFQGQVPLPVASYTIDVTLDPEAKTLVASEDVTYLNTTQESIPDLVFHLYLNAFRDENSIFLQESGVVGHRGYGWDPEYAGWVEVTSARLADGTPLALEEIEDGTLARAALPRPVPPGETLRVELDFQAQLPRVFARTGFAGDFFMVGQWFPKLGVWQEGAWNAYPFHANSEFYADFGDYDVTLTLPEGYVTGATGLPVSAEANGDGTQTVRYQAENVIDFAWTASPHFREATRQVEGVEVLYLYLPEHDWSVERALDAAEAAVRLYGGWFGKYPYPRLTVVDVPDDGQGAGGMEYPTLITAGTLNPIGEGPGLLGLPSVYMLEMVVIHEIGHQWWQSMVAFNEAEEPWLDEGFTEYSAARAMDVTYGEETSFIDTRRLRLSALDLRRAEYLSNPRVPMIGRAWDFQGGDYSVGAYAKPALSLRTLERTLGEEVMLDLMRTFFQRYQFGHPTTEDFRAVAEEVSGQDLAWFFDGLVYDDGVLNYAATGVGEHSVTVTRQGELRVPTEILVTFADGSQVLEVWEGQEQETTFSYPGRPPVRSVQIDPENKIIVDLQWGDNGLSRRLEVRPWLAVVSRLLVSLQNALLALGGL